MKPIEQNEIYEHFSQFLKNRGVELKEGSYSKGIQKGCNLLADAINISQRGIEKAKSGIDQKLDQMRQVIHEKTAPKKPAAAAAGARGAKPRSSAKAGRTKTKGTRASGKSKPK